MARKKAEPKKVLTKEERLASQREQLLQDFKNGNFFHCEEQFYLNPPTYRFNVGDKIKYGGMKETIIDEVLNDGYYYLIKCIAVKHNYGKNPFEQIEYQIVSWVHVRPLQENNVTSLAQNQDVRLYFSNFTIESILSRYYSLGINLNPDYQRELVWNEEDNICLIDSIFNNVDIGKFAFIHTSDEEWQKTHYSYEVLDGKQRLNAIILFYENRFPYKGKYFNDLSYEDRRAFCNHQISYADVKNASKKEIYKYFLLLNRTGKPMDKKQLEYIEQLYNKEDI